MKATTLTNTLPLLFFGAKALAVPVLDARINVLQSAVLFDGAAFQSPSDSSTTIAQLQAFVYLRQIDISSLVSAASSLFADTFGLDVSDGATNLASRLELFTAIGESGQSVDLTVTGCGDVVLGKTDGLGSNLGMVERNVTLGSCDGSDTFAATASVASFDNRDFNTTIFNHAPTGFGVISDIDDTLKITGVLDTATALQNTFLNDPEPIAGMPDVLSSLQTSLSDPAFFYISGSPFQLYPFLHDFIDSTYPAGPIYLQNLSFSDISGLVSFITDDDEIFDYKLSQIDNIQGMYPGRTFLTIGDSTQKDPETYGAAFRLFGSSFVSCIWIHLVDGANNTDARFAAAFVDVPATNYRLYTDEDITNGTLTGIDVAGGSC